MDCGGRRGAVRSSGVAEEGREDSQSVEEEEEGRDEVEVVVVVEEEEVEEDERRRVRTMERRGERWRGRSWPL